MAGAKILPLSRDSHVAMYRQLAQRRREAVARGDYKPGDRISTEQGLVPVTRLLDFSRAPPPAPVAARLGTGDTIAALHKFGITGRIGYISTAGGAFLEFLEGKTLPAVAALEARA